MIYSLGGIGDLILSCSQTNQETIILGFVLKKSKYKTIKS